MRFSRFSCENQLNDLFSYIPVASQFKLIYVAFQTPLVMILSRCTTENDVLGYRASAKRSNAVALSRASNYFSNVCRAVMLWKYFRDVWNAVALWLWSAGTEAPFGSCRDERI